MSSLDKIEHIVVLMLENRSFDCLLGKLYPATAAFDGLTGAEFNLDAAGNSVSVWNVPGMDQITMSTPTPDPGELWADINEQLFGSPDAPAAGQIPKMNGFVKNYMAQTDAAPTDYDPKSVMHFYTPEQVPVISALAKQFAVCDRWFASAPCQTWPNRFFVHTATANGYENNSPVHFPYNMETIFNRLEDAGKDWKIYFHDIAQAKTLSRLWLLPDHFHFFEAFKSDAAQDQLPPYSFIEPRYFTEWSMPNDQHPPHVVTLGEQLIADVYNNLRRSPAWTKTLLIITYDEHGGCYDHVPPPAATPPDPAPTDPFNFDRYGVRVPAVLVSPYIAQGTILRPSGATPFDHTSIIATLRKRFPELGAPLTDRDRDAPDLASVLSLDSPSNLGPERLDALPYAPSPALVAHAQENPLNGMQEALVKLAANLPEHATSADPVAIVAHAAIVGTAKKEPPPEALDNVRDGAAFVKQQLGKFFRSG